MSAEERDDPDEVVDPEEFLRRMLQISPEDAAEVREDAARRKRAAERTAEREGDGKDNL